MASAEELVEEWRRFCPPRVPLGDVRRVVKAYFEGFWRKGSREPIVIEHPCLAVDPYFRAGRFPIGAVKGREVKAVYVDRLLRAIALLEAWRRSGRDDIEP